MVIVFILLIVMLILFVLDYWRYDIVVLLILGFITVLGIIEFDQVFMGFSHPAIIAVAAILIITTGLANSGVVDRISNMLLKVGDNIIVQILVILVTVIVMSAFMNNIGALALLMPVVVRIANKKDKNPAIFLLPLAFGSIIGGWVTLIGTPPNLIISSFRAREGIGHFNMFEFTPVGIGIAIVCCLFIALGGWRLIPQRQISDKDGALSQVDNYLTEVLVSKDNRLIGKRFYELPKITTAEINIVSLMRNGERHPAPNNLNIFQKDDLLVIKGHPNELETLVNDTHVELSEERKFKEGIWRSEEVETLEVVIGPNSIMNRQSVRSFDLFNRYGINLLAIARQEEQLILRLKNVKLKTGDVLMIQGRKENLEENLSKLGWLPLAQRKIQLGEPRQMYVALIIFIVAVFLTVLNILPVHIAFALAALSMVIFRIVPLQELYKSVNWPVIIFLAALIPIGLSLEVTGGDRFISSILLDTGFITTPLIALIAILIISIILSNIVDNVAAVIIMSPIAITLAIGFGVSIDPFLITILIGASSAFLTPIGHQSNILIMGPAGFKFGDYWKLGIFLELIVVFIGVPLILFFFPF